MGAMAVLTPLEPNAAGATGSWRSPPCVVYEDEHILVVHKPAGWSTHAPSPWAGEGLYEWLRHQEPRWADLAILHRLDKDTSGVMVFGKTALANRALTEQFSQQVVRKRYVFWSHRPGPCAELTVRSCLVRRGARYLSRPVRPGAPLAETHFRWATAPMRVTRPAGPQSSARESLEVWPGTARPRTGRTHQIRAQAAAAGFPILGDVLYGGQPWPRVCLHAAELTFRHPATGRWVTFEAPADFLSWPGLALRRACIDPAQTDAYRLIHGAADGWPGWYVDRLGSYLLCQSERAFPEGAKEWLLSLHPAVAIYHKVLRRHLEDVRPSEVASQPVHGQPAPARFLICENGLRFELSLKEGYSVGLFLDQRENRRRLLTGHVAAHFTLQALDASQSREPMEVLNTFAYTCGFSVAAAKAGARVTSLDLSRKYLTWGQRNFQLNQLEPTFHAFVSGDVREWFRRWHRQGRRFDVVLLDPPTFSRSKVSGVFRVEKDLSALITAAAQLLVPGGVLFVSSNAARWAAPDFVEAVHSAVQAAGRRILQHHYVPQPPDFPVHPEEPPHLKSLWLRLE